MYHGLLLCKTQVAGCTCLDAPCSPVAHRTRPHVPHVPAVGQCDESSGAPVSAPKSRSQRLRAKRRVSRALDGTAVRSASDYC